MCQGKSNIFVKIKLFNTHISLFTLNLVCFCFVYVNFIINRKFCKGFYIK
jgi:hypothetical protein